MRARQRERVESIEYSSWERGEEVKTGYVMTHEEKIIPQKKLQIERLEMLYRRYMNYSCLYNNDSTTKLSSQNWGGVVTISLAIGTTFSQRAGKQKESLKQQPFNFLNTGPHKRIFMYGVS